MQEEVKFSFKTKKDILSEEADPHAAVAMEIKKREFEYDIFVIGGGSGGLALAKEANRLGAKVGLADYVKPTPKGTKWGLGGTCVNVGCIPKKLMHFAAMTGETIPDKVGAGWLFEGKISHEWGKMQEKVGKYIGKLNWGYKVQLMQKEIDYFNALASFQDQHTILLKFDGKPEKKVTSKDIVIAVGGRPNYEAIPGAKEYAITSDDLFWIKKNPGKTLVVGASYVALECAGFLHGVGVDTSLMVRSIFLRGYDQDMAERVGNYMEKHGVKMFKKAVPTNLAKTPAGKILVTYDCAGKKSDLEFDTVLLAIGRRAVTEDLNLSAVGIPLEPNDKIKVNDKEETLVPNIYALGDVIFGRPELTPVAIRAGRLLAARILGQGVDLMDYHNVPSTVYTPLEYGFCGYSEEDAYTKFGKENIDVYHTSFKPLEWNFLESREDDACYTKIIVRKMDHVVIGFHYLGPNAGEITQGYAVAVQCGVTKEQWDKTVGIHPTCAEEAIGMKTTKAESAVVKKTGC